MKEHGGSNRSWRFEEYGNGWYRIRAVRNMQNGYPNGGCLTGGGRLWKPAG
ncbi:hypothetical protein [Streptomyces sp. XY431]|uniref:hypothetical protein n=1 Tax=Streptomyces sp. XY431 TaxID=1415562 RepID=UPI000AEDDF35|nr:hypothetical protein [Streptomyces sp. XY431]